MKNLIKKAQRIFRRIILDSRVAAFIRHNREIWKNNDTLATEGEILLEMNDMASSIISYSYLANILARVHRATITAYVLRGKKFWSGLIDHKIKAIYRSFNALRFIYLDLDQTQKREVDRLFVHIYPLLKTKRDVDAQR